MSQEKLPISGKSLLALKEELIRDLTLASSNTRVKEVILPKIAEFAIDGKQDKVNSTLEQYFKLYTISPSDQDLIKETITLFTQENKEAIQNAHVQVIHEKVNPKKVEIRTSESKTEDTPQTPEPTLVNTPSELEIKKIRPTPLLTQSAEILRNTPRVPKEKKLEVKGSKYLDRIKKEEYELSDKVSEYLREKDKNNKKKTKERLGKVIDTTLTHLNIQPGDNEERIKYSEEKKRRSTQPEPVSKKIPDKEPNQTPVLTSNNTYAQSQAISPISSSNNHPTTMSFSNNHATTEPLINPEKNTVHHTGKDFLSSIPDWQDKDITLIEDESTTTFIFKDRKHHANDKIIIPSTQKEVIESLKKQLSVGKKINEKEEKNDTPFLLTGAESFIDKKNTLWKIEKITKTFIYIHSGEKKKIVRKQDFLDSINQGEYTLTQQTQEILPQEIESFNDEYGVIKTIKEIKGDLVILNDGSIELQEDFLQKIHNGDFTEIKLKSNSLTAENTDRDAEDETKPQTAQELVSGLATFSESIAKKVKEELKWPEEIVEILTVKEIADIAKENRVCMLADKDFYKERVKQHKIETLKREIAEEYERKKERSEKREALNKELVEIRAKIAMYENKVNEDIQLEPTEKEPEAPVVGEPKQLGEYIDFEEIADKLEDSKFLYKLLNENYSQIGFDKTMELLKIAGVQQKEGISGLVDAYITAKKTKSSPELISAVEEIIRNLEIKK